MGKANLKQNINSLLYQKVSKKHFSPSHVAEVGVWYPHTSNIYQFITQNIKTTLVEPDPDSIRLIKEAFNHYAVTLHQVAVCDFGGTVELCKRKSSSFISTLSKSPAMVNDAVNVDEAEKVTVTAKTFNQLDDKTIDLISIDTEGSEWFVIKNMQSRPAVIALETHGGLYINPYLGEIKNWMTNNGYQLWYQDKSDSVFSHPSYIKLNLIDRLICWQSILMVRLKYLEKKINQIKHRIIAKKIIFS